MKWHLLLLLFSVWTAAEKTNAKKEEVKSRESRDGMSANVNSVMDLGQGGTFHVSGTVNLQQLKKDGSEWKPKHEFTIGTGAKFLCNYANWSPDSGPSSCDIRINNSSVILGPNSLVQMGDAKLVTKKSVYDSGPSEPKIQLDELTKLVIADKAEVYNTGQLLIKKLTNSIAHHTIPGSLTIGYNGKLTIDQGKITLGGSMKIGTKAEFNVNVNSWIKTDDLSLIKVKKESRLSIGNFLKFEAPIEESAFDGYFLFKNKVFSPFGLLSLQDYDDVDKRMRIQYLSSHLKCKEYCDALGAACNLWYFDSRSHCLTGVMDELYNENVDKNIYGNRGHFSMVGLRKIPGNIETDNCIEITDFRNYAIKHYASGKYLSVSETQNSLSSSIGTNFHMRYIRGRFVLRQGKQKALERVYNSLRLRNYTYNEPPSYDMTFFLKRTPSGKCQIIADLDKCLAYRNGDFVVSKHRCGDVESHFDFELVDKEPESKRANTPYLLEMREKSRLKIEEGELEFDAPILLLSEASFVKFGPERLAIHFLYPYYVEQHSIKLGPKSKVSMSGGRLNGVVHVGAESDVRISSTKKRFNIDQQTQLIVQVNSQLHLEAERITIAASYLKVYGHAVMSCKAKEIEMQGLYLIIPRQSTISCYKIAHAKVSLSGLLSLDWNTGLIFQGGHFQNQSTVLSPLVPEKVDPIEFASQLHCDSEGGTWLRVEYNQGKCLNYGISNRTEKERAKACFAANGIWVSASSKGNRNLFAALPSKKAEGCLREPRQPPLTTQWLGKDGGGWLSSMTRLEFYVEGYAKNQDEWTKVNLEFQDGLQNQGLIEVNGESKMRSLVHLTFTKPVVLEPDAVISINISRIYQSDMMFHFPINLSSGEVRHIPH